MSAGLLCLRQVEGFFSCRHDFTITIMVVFLDLITIIEGMLINNDNDLCSFSGISDSLLATIGSVTREGRRPPGHYHHHHHHHHCYQYQDDHRVTAFYPLWCFKQALGCNSIWSENITINILVNTIWIVLIPRTYLQLNIQGINVFLGPGDYFSLGPRRHRRHEQHHQLPSILPENRRKKTVRCVIA